MSCRIGDLRNKQVVCVKTGTVLGFVSDVEINTADGSLEAIVIFGRPKLFGLFGREEDVVIPWKDIEVLGLETILVSTDASAFIGTKKSIRFPF